MRMKCVSVSVCGVVLWSLRFDLSWVGLGCLIPSGSSWMMRINTPTSALPVQEGVMVFFSKEIVFVAVRRWMLMLARTKALFAFSDEFSHRLPTTFTTTSMVEWSMDIDVGENSILVVHPSGGKNKNRNNNTYSEQGRILYLTCSCICRTENKQLQRQKHLCTRT